MSFKQRTPLKRSASFFEVVSSEGIDQEYMSQPFRSFVAEREQQFDGAKRSKLRSFQSIGSPRLSTRLARKNQPSLLSNIVVTVGNSKRRVISKLQRFSRSGTPIHSLTTLETLSAGLLREIASYLSPKDILRLSLASSSLRHGLVGVPLCFAENRTFTPSELKILSKFWNVVSVSISPSLESFWPALDLRNLRSLSLKGEWRCMNIQPLSDSFMLENLSFKAGVSRLHDLKTLKSKYNLQTITIRNCIDIFNLKFLPWSRALKEVDLAGCVNLVNLENMHCPELECMNLSGCTSLVDISKLKTLPLLRKLDLSYCSFISDLSILTSFPHLKELNLAGLDRVEDISFLPSLELRRVGLKGCSIPLLLSLSVNIISSTKIFENRALLIESIKSSVSVEGWIYESCLEHILRLLYVFTTTNKFMKYSKRYNFELVSTLLTMLVNFTVWETSHKTINGIQEITALLRVRFVENNEQVSFAKMLDGVTSYIKRLHRQSDPIKLETSLAQIIARISHHRPSVIPLCAETQVLSMLYTMLLKATGGEKRRELSAAAVLLIALEPELRAQILEKGIVSLLVDGVIEKDCPETFKVESAGALWNLAASLEIGTDMLVAEPRLVDTLLLVVQSSNLNAKIQAVGALRNLSILKKNKTMMMADPVKGMHLTKTLLELVRSLGSGQLDTEEDENDQTEFNLLIKTVATLRILASDTRAQEYFHEHFDTMKQSGEEPMWLFNKLISSKSDALVTQTAGFLLALSFSKKIRRLIAEILLLKAMIKLISTSNVESVLVSCSGCLWNLAMDDYCECIIVSLGAFPALLGRLGHTAESVVFKSIGAIKNLTYNASNKNALMVANGPMILCNIVREADSYTNQKIVEYAIGTLRLLASGSPEVKRQLVRSRLKQFLQSQTKMGKLEGHAAAIQSILEHLDI